MEFQMGMVDEKKRSHMKLLINQCTHLMYECYHYYTFPAVWSFLKRGLPLVEMQHNTTHSITKF